MQPPTIHPRLRALINPTVLTEVMERIEQKTQHEGKTGNFERYLNAHADHIMTEVARRANGNGEPQSTAEDERAA